MKELLEKRAKVFEQARALVLKAEKETRALTAEEQTEYDARMADVKAIGETITRSRESAEMEAQLSRSLGPRRGENGNDPQQRGRTPGSDLADAALDTFIRRGGHGLNEEQRSVFGRSDSAGGDHIVIRAASPLSYVTGAAGADTIPTGFVNQLETNLKWFGGMRQSRATILRTSSGQPLPWPTQDDTSNVGELVGEDTDATQAVTEMSFGQVNFGAWTYSSKIVKVPIQLIQDSAFDVQAFVAKALGIRLGRIQNTHFTTGDGNSKPSGLITGAALGVTAANTHTTDVTYANLVDLEHSVDPAYRVGAQFMFNDTTAAYLEKLVDGNSRPLLNSSLAGIDGPVVAGQPGVVKYTIKGYEVVLNSDMANLGVSGKAVAFGDMSKYVIRDVLDLLLIRFNELYMTRGQIGFLCWMRTDGHLVDANAHPVRYFQNASA